VESKSAAMFANDASGARFGFPRGTGKEAAEAFRAAVKLLARQDLSPAPNPPIYRVSGWFGRRAEYSDNIP